MDVLDLLTRAGTYVLAVIVFIATFFTRKVVEMVWPSLKKKADANDPGLTYLTEMSRWWNEVILYAIPVIFGVGAAFSDSEFLFDGVDGGAKFMFGGAIGWFSSFLYKALKKAVAGKAGVEVPEENE